MSSKKDNKKKGRKKGRGIIGFFGLLVLLIAVLAMWFVFMPVLNTSAGQKKWLYIKTGEKFEDAVERWQLNGDLRKPNLLGVLAKIPQVKSRVHSGAYSFSSFAGQLPVFLKIVKGQEDEINVTLSGRIGLGDVISRISSKLEPDSAEISRLLANSDFLDSIGFTRDNVLCMFIPDTYRFYWDTEAEKVILKFLSHYHTYWSVTKQKQAFDEGLNPVKTGILASIVDGEAMHFDEMPMIAGLYINRLNKPMPLQADPTVKFALGDPSIKRLTFDDYKFKHRYNTYVISGLPPGPISLPSKQAIEAVLNYKKHSYFYMVAKPDGSGYHHFSESYKDHLAYRKEYVKSLNARGVGR